MISKNSEDNILREQLKRIPQIDRFLLQPEMAELREKYPGLILKFAREAAEELRELALAGKNIGKADVRMKNLILKKLDYCLAPKLKPVINASGVILHTGLGRASLSQATQENISNIARGYSNLEYNLDTGKRGQRLSAVDSLICELTGAEKSAVVNNNAAAVLLALNSLVYRKEVIISRGELVEIGGSFRIPEIMKKSGTKMVEIGTTNRTNPADYDNAISKRTGAILKVHTSNYKVMGFTQETGIEEVVSIGKKHNIPVISDLGGGVLIDLQEWGLPYEPVAEEHVKAGADLVTFSGDKVLGGPQSGIICGKEWAVQKCRKNHLMRALRCDKLILGALETTLKGYLTPGNLREENIAIRMLTEQPETIRERAAKFADWLNSLNHPKLISAETRESSAQAGSGALPLEKLPSFAVYIKPEGFLNGFARRLRMGEQPVIGLLHDDELVLDFRTVFPQDEELLKEAVLGALNAVRFRG